MESVGIFWRNSTESLEVSFLKWKDSNEWSYGFLRSGSVDRIFFLPSDVENGSRIAHNSTVMFTVSRNSRGNKAHGVVPVVVTKAVPSVETTQHDAMHSDASTSLCFGAEGLFGTSTYWDEHVASGLPADEYPDPCFGAKEMFATETVWDERVYVLQPFAVTSQAHFPACRPKARMELRLGHHVRQQSTSDELTKFIEVLDNFTVQFDAGLDTQGDVCACSYSTAMKTLFIPLKDKLVANGFQETAILRVAKPWRIPVSKTRTKFVVRFDADIRVAIGEDWTEWFHSTFCGVEHIAEGDYVVGLQGALHNLSFVWVGNNCTEPVVIPTQECSRGVTWVESQIDNIRDQFWDPTGDRQ